MFPKVPDYHKPGKPLIPNGLGILYVLASVTYLFILHTFIQDSGNFSALLLAVCVLFGGFMGLLDDWLDLRWRYKAFFPIFVALPLIAFRLGDPIMATYFFGKIDFGIYFYLVIIPLILTIVTNSVNQLGGLNGLETIGPSIILCGLLLGADPQFQILLIVPLFANLILTYFNFQGKIFIGNTGSFALGITLASFSLISNNEQTLVVSLIPYIINSSMILFSVFILKSRASVSLINNRLHSTHRRSLVTLITYKTPLKEKTVVLIIALLIALSSFTALVVQKFLL